MVWLQPAPGWNNQDAYRDDLYQVTRIGRGKLSPMGRRIRHSFVLAEK